MSNVQVKDYAWVFKKSQASAYLDIGHSLLDIGHLKQPHHLTVRVNINFLRRRHFG
jgi:hypothetical protein